VDKTSRLLATGIVLLAVPPAAPIAEKGVTPASHQIQSPLQLPPFSSIQVRNGGHVVARPAPAQRVTLLRGSLDYTRVAVTDGGVLVIDKCKVHCPRGYELEIEILMPKVSRISLANGGRIQTLGTFAAQADLGVAVAHGGTIDVRSMDVERVNASVEQGGRILTVPRRSLSARVNQGGVITYWGNARVDSSVEHGGVVNKGTPEEINVPLGEIGPAVLDPVAPIHALRHERR